MRRIMSREAYEQGRCRQSAQDGSREFITLLACVLALGKTIPPTLLYKGQSGDLQNTWVEDLGAEDDLFFGATENGWTNDKYGMMWLQEVFEPTTRITTKLLEPVWLASVTNPAHTILAPALIDIHLSLRYVRHDLAPAVNRWQLFTVEEGLLDSRL
jgi:DDE superfamily endonuclease